MKQVQKLPGKNLRFAMEQFCSIEYQMIGPTEGACCCSACWRFGSHLPFRAKDQASTSQLQTFFQVPVRHPKWEKNRSSLFTVTQKRPGYEPLVALEVSKVSVPRPEAAPTMDTVQQETDLQIGIKCASFLFITPSTEKVRSFTQSFFPGFKFETANVPETLGTPRACPNTKLLPKDAKDAKM
jgi:hypothetical protein